MITEIITINTEDGLENDGYIEKSNNNDSKEIVIATHGMNSNCFRKREKTIAKYCAENNIDFMVFNNRGTELAKSYRKLVDGKLVKELGGTCFENPEEGYIDIVAAINKALSLGYENIYLQGHSLGSTKMLYTYTRLKKENSELLKYIKGIILLSLVDIPRALKWRLQEEYNDVYNLALDKEKQGKIFDFMPDKTFICSMSVRTFLKYARDNENINFAQYANKEYDFNEINGIDVPVFMRWGNEHELIEQDAKDLVHFMNDKIKNPKKDINYIDGANHSYQDKEDLLANQIVSFIKNS